MRCIKFTDMPAWRSGGKKGAHGIDFVPIEVGCGVVCREFLNLLVAFCLDDADAVDAGGIEDRAEDADFPCCMKPAQ